MPSTHFFHNHIETIVQSAIARPKRSPITSIHILSDSTIQTQSETIQLSVREQGKVMHDEFSNRESVMKEPEGRDLYKQISPIGISQ